MRPKGVGIPTDILAVNIWRSLYEDFDLGGVFKSAKEALSIGDLKAYRDKCTREVGIVQPPRFKRIKQLENLLKKYRFESDVYTSEELEVITNEKYLSNQVRLSEHHKGGVTLRAHYVLQRARKIAKRILGDPNIEEIELLSKFGKKSSIGCPLSLAYIDHKLTDSRAFTGSAACADWFFSNILPKDPILDQLVQRIRIKPGHPNLQHRNLVLKNVPKTWKVHRGITPLTLIDLFYTYGVGRAVQRRLKKHGLDIRYLQDNHRRVVRKFSLSLTHATADLSAASDSITIHLLSRILPRSWYNLVKRACTHQVKIGDRLFYTESVLPMGNGLTFPVETLVFYCITKAIGELLKVDGLYSVFGDDLVYPSKIHKAVAALFPEFGLILNTDKTFVSFPFRESCGEDFYRGVPVRSFYLSNAGSPRLSGRELEGYLYSIINGLLRRWDEHEIPKTLNFLLRALAQCTFRVLRVPPSFPDTSGIKVEDPTHRLLGEVWTPYEPVKLYYSDGSRWFQFKYLRFVAKKRFIKCQEPYYWQTLAGDSDEPEGEFKRVFNPYTEVPTSSVGWQKQSYTRYFKFKGKRRRKVFYKLRPYVSSRIVEQIRLQETS
jgi:hypothetical protein